MSNEARPSPADPADPGFFRLSAKVVAVGCIVITAAAIACLIVVISVGDSSNTLASTALAFGLVAFMSQLVIAVAQFASAEKTRIESNRINAGTRAILADIQATTRSLDERVRDMAGEALSEATGYVSGLATTPEEEAVTDEVIRRINEGWPGRAVPASDHGHKQRLKDLNQQVVDWLKSVDVQAFASADLPPDVPHAFMVGDLVILVVLALGRFGSFGGSDLPGEVAVMSFQMKQAAGDVKAEALVVWERGGGDEPVRTEMVGYKAINAWPGVLDQALEMIRNPEDPFEEAMETLE